MSRVRAIFVFPHQLFECNFSKDKKYIFYLLEEPLFFTQYNFHKQKLIFHRASMKYYESRLTSLGFKVCYFDFLQLKNSEIIQNQLKADAVDEVFYYQVIDDWLDSKIRKDYARGFNLCELNTPMFLCTNEMLNEDFYHKEHLSMSTFYITQRKRLKIMLSDKRPLGGKWSFDTANRKKLPNEITPPDLIKIATNSFIFESLFYIDKNFHHNIGSISHYNYAVTHEDARKCLHDFLIHRFSLFGPYEDSISQDFPFVFHSVISPYLNTGLLTPDEVILDVLNFVEGEDIKLNSIEGFIRQIIGWREFIRAVYIFRGREVRTKNFWAHTNNLPVSFYSGETGIEPVDIIIKRVLKYSYCHHIERLMILGNFMLLCEINPVKIYQWFMEMYIDAYDWVMIPNVYSMSQYADGGLVTTKPYLSSSNYVLKMSDFNRGEWSDIWDALYWRFINKHKDFFTQNPRLSIMTAYLKKMSPDKLKKYNQVAEDFLISLFR